MRGRLFLAEGSVKYRLANKKVSKTFGYCLHICYLCIVVRQEVLSHHETFRTNSAVEKGWMPFETAWCFA